MGISAIDSTFNGGEVRLDGGDFVRTKFIGATIIYGGGPLPKMSGCAFERCGFVFDGAAGRTIDFLKQFYAAGGTDVIDQVFKAITLGVEDEQPPRV